MVDGSDLFGGILRRIAWTLVGAWLIEEADEPLVAFGRRFPRTLRFARVVGGTSLVLVGLYEAVLSIVVLADLLGGGEGLVSLILLVPLAFGIGIVACGLGMIRRGWANAEPDVPEVGDRQPRQVRRPVPDSEVGSAASGWLTALAGIALWITAPVGLALWVTGSILMLLAGVPFTLAMLLGWLLPAAVHLVSRLWSSRRPDV